MALFVATHWPALTIPMKGRWDLPIHASVFAGWNVLFMLLGAFGNAFSPRNIVLSSLVATAYAGLDEGLQALPFVRRTAAWDDFAANALGVWLAAIITHVVFSRRTQPEGGSR